METSIPPEDSFLESFEVESSSSSSIKVQWHVQGAIVAFIDGFRVHHQKVASTYIQYGPKLLPTTTVYQIKNLVADTYYKVCLVTYRNDTSPLRQCVDASTTNWQLPVSIGSSIGAILALSMIVCLVTYRNDTSPLRQCVDASTTNWQLPVSIGSSIGAILALSMIVLIVLLSRCKLPYRYRKKMKTEPDKYDAMSSNFHDEHYDFSETVTQGNDDDFTSEMDQDESGWYETSYHEQKYLRRPVEKIGCVNGNIRNSVPPHAHLLNQKRHSLGRIHAHGYPSHHAKPIRAFSIQTEHPCSPLAKESPRRHSSDKEWQETNDDILQTSLKSSQRTIRSDSVGHNRKPICTCLNEMIPTKRDKVLQKQRSVNEVDDPLLFSQQAQDFLFIDDIPEANKVTDSNENSTSLKNVLQMNDVSFDDLSEFGAAACQNDITGSRLPKSVEMSTKGRLKLLHDHRSIEEHAV